MHVYSHTKNVFREIFGVPLFMYINSFLKGVPYAEAPVGDKRFQPPSSRTPRSGIQDAVKLPPACPQSSKFSVTSSNDTNEDCLYLNIYAAESVTMEDLRPVMIWIHPGRIK